MPEFTIKIEGQRGEAVERYASLADMSPEDLITRWIKDKVDHVTVQAMRAAGKPWEAVAEVLGYSTTQARRIYAQGLDMPLISKETVKILERYVDLIERAEEIHLWTPSEDDVLTVDSLTEALNEAAEAGKEVQIPTEEDIDTVSRLTKALNEAAEAREG
jgi:hypothetical protein